MGQPREWRRQEGYTIDFTVPGANWRPWNTDLNTACGEYTAMSVREVLDVGSGDSYGQWRAGQRSG